MRKLWLIYLVLVGVFLIPNGNEWVIRQSKIVQMLLHPFFHGNIFHLLANALTLYLIVPRAKTWHLVAGYALGALSLLAVSNPVIGFSNIIYAVIGVRSPSFDSYWWKHPGTHIFLAVTLAMLLLPNVSAVTHIVSFVGGVIVSVLSRWFKQIENVSARYI